MASISFLSPLGGRPISPWRKSLSGFRGRYAQSLYLVPERSFEVSEFRGHSITKSYSGRWACRLALDFRPVVASSLSP